MRVNRSITRIASQNKTQFNEILDVAKESSVSRSDLKSYIAMEMPFSKRGLRIRIGANIALSTLAAATSVYALTDGPNLYMGAGSVVAGAVGCCFSEFILNPRKFYCKVNGIEPYEKVRERRIMNKGYDEFPKDGQMKWWFASEKI